MQREILLRYFGHSHWANRHVMELLSQLPNEVLAAENTRFYRGGAWDAVKHIADVEWSWLLCCQGKEMTAWLWDVHPFGNLREALAFIEAEYPRVEAYLASLSDADLASPVQINAARPEDAPKVISRADLLIHILNHGAEHRGDLAHFLTDHNLSPGDLDYLDWLLAHGAQMNSVA